MHVLNEWTELADSNKQNTQPLSTLEYFPKSKKPGQKEPHIFLMSVYVACLSWFEYCVFVFGLGLGLGFGRCTSSRLLNRITHKVSIGLIVLALSFRILYGFSFALCLFHQIHTNNLYVYSNRIYAIDVLRLPGIKGKSETIFTFC